MDLENYIFAGIILLGLLIVGLILLLVWNSFKKKQDYRKFKFIEKFVFNKGREAFVEMICECMDIMPEKIQEVKRSIDEGGI